MQSFQEEDYTKRFDLSLWKKIIRLAKPYHKNLLMTMGFMALINVPVCLILGSTAFKALEDYVAQRKAGKDPVFKASSIGVKDTDYWN